MKNEIPINGYMYLILNDNMKYYNNDKIILITLYIRCNSN